MRLWLVWRLYVGTWVHYLAIFHIKKVEDDLKARGQRLGPMSRFFGYWVLLPKGLLLDWLLWQTLPALHTLLGTAMIVGSGLVLLRSEKRGTNRTTKNLRAEPGP